MYKARDAFADILGGDKGRATGFSNGSSGLDKPHGYKVSNMRTLPVVPNALLQSARADIYFKPPG